MIKLLVKKITLADVAMVVGMGLMVLGIGVKMKGAEKVNSTENKVRVEQGQGVVKGLVNINTATIVELEVLPAIGPKTAQKIIDYRNKYGKFATKESIKRVSGIGEKTYEKLADKIEI